MNPEKINRNILILLVVLFCCFVFFWEKRAHEIEKIQLFEQAQVIENDLWNLDPRGPVQYLKLAARHSRYESIKVFAIKNEPFIKIDGPEINRLQRIFIKAGLISKIKLDADILHNDQIIGRMEVMHLHDTIYLYLYLFLVFGLIFLSFKFFVQVLHEKKMLEIRVKERTKDLQTSEIRFRSLIEQSPFSTTIYSPQGYINYINPAAIELWNIPVQDLQEISANYNLLQDEQLKANDLMPLIEKGFTGSIVTIPPILYNPSKTEAFAGFKKDAFWALGYLYPIKDTDGNIKELILIHEDVTQRIETANELDSHRKHLEKLVARRTSQLAAINKELETFTYSVSHDLKAPLRGIDGYSKLLLEDYFEVLDNDGQTFLKNIRKAIEQMNKLITDLLAYSRMERRSLIPQQIDLRHVFERILSERRHEFETQKIKLILDIPETLVTADVESLNQVLGNLIDNAVKYTKNIDVPIIEIKGLETREALILTIKDNGIGFDMKYHDQIFKIFQRLHHLEEYKGTGVGLAIVKKAVDHMQGSIRAQSEPGKGATFFLELPKKLIKGKL